MKYLVFCLAAFLAGCQPKIPVESFFDVNSVDGDIGIAYTFPKYVINNNKPAEICGLDNGTVLSAIERLQGKDKFALEHLSRGDWYGESNSLTVAHGLLSGWWSDYTRIAYDLVLRRDEDAISTLINQLQNYADNDLFLNTLSARQANRQKCWSGGGSAPCPFHLVQHNSFALGTLLYVAVLMKPYMSAAEHKAIDEYFSRAWGKHLRFIAYKPLGPNRGFYEWGNGGIQALLYAQWKDDYSLLKEEIEFRASQLDFLIDNQGYIDNNSFRGVRAYFYHTLGADSAFSYAILARSYGFDFFEHDILGAKFKALAKTTIVGLDDYERFRSRGNRGYNYSTNPNDTRVARHSLATNLPIIMKREYGIAHDGLVRRRDEDQMNDLIAGFNAECFYQTRAGD